MGKQKIELNLDEQEQFTPVKQYEEEAPKAAATPKRKENSGPKSCLRNETVTVRLIPKLRGIWGNNPKHVLAGGMADGTTRTFEVPMLSSGTYMNVLTDEEKEYLEELLGLEPNAMSVYKKPEVNFWCNANPNGISQVRLTKEDSYLNLSDPRQYIMYKILLANKNAICPSLEQLEDMPKPSYQFVIIREGDEDKKQNKQMSTVMEAYKEFGKIEDNFDVLKLIVEILDGRSVSKKTSIESLKTKVNQHIQSNSKTFLKVVKDPLLNTKVLIKKAIEAAIISNRGGMLYLRKDSTPLCNDGEEPTLNTAAKFLEDSRHQELLFSIEAQLK